jgi:hypothetical protein
MATSSIFSFAFLFDSCRTSSIMKTSKADSITNFAFIIVYCINSQSVFYKLSELMTIIVLFSSP